MITISLGWHLIKFTDADDRRYANYLFSAFCLTVPTVAWFIFADGLVPVWYYLPIAIGGGFLGLILGTIHLLVYGTVLRFVAVVLTQLIFNWVHVSKGRFWVLLGIFLGLGLLALNPIYSPVTHRGTNSMNLIMLMFRFPFLKG